MTIHPTSFKDWQSYPSTLDPIHLAWLKKAKKSKTAFSVAEIPKLGSGKTDFSATKKIALVNNQG